MDHQRIIAILVKDTCTRQVLEQGLIMDGWTIGARAQSMFAVTDLATSGPGAVSLPPGKIRLGDMLAKARYASDNRGRAASGILEIMHFSLDLASLTLTDKRNARSILLTEKERDILVRLDQAGHDAVDRKTLLADIWSYADTVETHTLETHIYRLRQKIEDDPASPGIVVTDGNGYRLGPAF